MTALWFYQGMFMKRIGIIVALMGAQAIAGCGDGAGDDPSDVVSSDRIEAALMAVGVKKVMAACMAPTLVDELASGQIGTLEEFGDRAGAAPGSLSMGKAMARLRRIDDRDMVEKIVQSGGSCGFELMMGAS
ncbi:hypothetical protein [Parerythrobacter jejuensis]|uniref:DUF4197 domain-containing protein n=1 Tax=Parerythrobacter jejuensis TaxID=795812 RepID=A0A845AS34_9SPHN|nr:hypothetical protein [Parerythrobacter jejuensis]MXP31755.1 hypothetical protein [Parerythrobacter jejuensis]